MNYHHIFHAGNRCDVVKHAVLTLVLRHLRGKDKAFAVLDTHAGIGLYDLQDDRAQKSGEAAEGILSFLSAPPLAELSDFYDILRKINPLWTAEALAGFRTYPGSPLLAFHGSRAQDRVIACEWHPQDAQLLQLNAPADKRMQIHHRNGYEALGAFLPPPEKRGLVLIDPPFEQPDEFKTLVKKLREAHSRWPTGHYIVWYPVKNRPAIWQFHEDLVKTGIPKILCAEFVYEENSRADRLTGSGLIIINPPWKLDEELSALYPALHAAMKTPYAGTSVRWLSDEGSNNGE